MPTEKVKSLEEQLADARRNLESWKRSHEHMRLNYMRLELTLALCQQREMSLRSRLKQVEVEQKRWNLQRAIEEANK